MEALLLLTGDHNHVRGLFTRFKTAEESGNTDTAAELATMILTELEVHTTIEEEIFYPAITENDELSGIVDEGIEEHLVAKRLMEEVAALAPGDDQWTAKMKVLMESVEHHAGEEEKEMFPKVRSNFSKEQRTALAEQMEARKGQLGAPTLDMKADLTDTRLRQLASDQEIPGRSKMGREELQATVAPD